MKRIHFTALLVILPLAANADALPAYDVEGHCKAVASFGGNYSAVLDNACLEMEQAAYDRLKASWSELPAEARTHCDKVARFGGKGSFSLLQACLEQEVQARANRPSFKRD